MLSNTRGAFPPCRRVLLNCCGLKKPQFVKQSLKNRMHWTAVSGVGKEIHMFIYISKKICYTLLIFSIFHSKSCKSDCNKAVQFPPICTISFEGQL